MTLLQASGISMRFGGVQALRKVDVQQNVNETLGMIGPNGSGKTTFVNAITGHLKPTEGDITFDGARLVGRRPFAIASVGLTRTYQAVRVFGQLTAQENVEVMLRLRRLSLCPSFDRRLSCGWHRLQRAADSGGQEAPSRR